jgi:S-DNA-T family DNA segregation ATPase FtsK/SpoIIIE
MARDPYRRQMRRARRAMRKGENPYSVMIVGPDEPFTFIALAAISTWAFRHRSAFAPFIITLAAFITAAITHTHHARWWIPVSCATVLLTILLGIPHRLLWARPAGQFTAGILVRMWEACGIDRAIERAYAGTVIAVAGGWLSAAIAIGPAVKPLPLIALIGSVVLGIPWWFHRRRRQGARGTHRGQLARYRR